MLLGVCCIHSRLPTWHHGKESACQCRRRGLIPRSEISHGEGNGNPLRYSCLENSHGQSSLLGYSPWGCRVRRDFFTLLFHPHQEVRPETIKLLEENIGRTLDDINQSKILYDPPSRVVEIKTKVNKWDLIKLKKFCTAKEPISKVTRPPSEWEKIIANETTHKGLISKICKQLIQLNTRKTNNPKNLEKDLNRHFSKEDIQMANKHIKKMLSNYY